MKNYLFTFGSSFGTREDAKFVLSKCPSISRWRTDMINSFYLKSLKQANEIAEEIRSNKSSGRFLIVEITNNSQGWIQKDSWSFINEEE